MQNQLRKIRDQLHWWDGKKIGSTTWCAIEYHDERSKIWMEMIEVDHQFDFKTPLYCPWVEQRCPPYKWNPILENQFNQSLYWSTSCMSKLRGKISGDNFHINPIITNQLNICRAVLSPQWKNRYISLGYYRKLQECTHWYRLSKQEKEQMSQNLPRMPTHKLLGRWLFSASKAWRGIAQPIKSPDHSSKWIKWKPKEGSSQFENDSGELLDIRWK